MRILIVDDEPRFARLLETSLRQDGRDEVWAAGSAEAALDHIDRTRVDLVLTDLRLPGLSGLELLGHLHRDHPETAVVLMTAYAEVATAREALKRGALDYLVKPFKHEELTDILDQARARCATDSRTGEGGDASTELAGIVGRCSKMQRVFREIRTCAPTDLPVLVLGESGTGKELVARALHRLSHRHRGPFVEVHAAAIPESMIESELFGHEKGAFTGAGERKPGLVELASGGTLFLDEIGEMPASLQPRLLRVLQDQRFYRVGGTEPVTVDVRVVAATNRDLAAEVTAGRFREDLFYRLAVASIHLPPLRDRSTDIPQLVHHLLRGRARLGAGVVERLADRPWPGNIRQLRNVVERLVLHSNGDIIRAEHVDRALGEDVTPRSAHQVIASAGSANLADHERQLIREALTETGGNKTRAAELLGITRRRLYSRLKLLDLDGV